VSVTDHGLSTAAVATDTPAGIGQNLFEFIRRYVVKIEFLNVSVVPEADVPGHRLFSLPPNCISDEFRQLRYFSQSATGPLSGLGFPQSGTIAENHPVCL
jgi:hypothetical protein